MRMNLKVFLATAVLVTGMGLNAQAAVTVGEPAPDFRAVDTKGVEHSLSAYRGKYVVLEWINHDCPFIKKHYNSGNMQKLQKEYTAQDVIWLSVSSSADGNQGHYKADDADRLTVEKGASPTAVLLDAEGVVGHAFGAKTTPHMFVIDPEGLVIYQGAIDDIPSTDLNDVEGANNYVTAALNAAMGGQPIAVPSTKSYGCSVKY